MTDADGPLTSHLAARFAEPADAALDDVAGADALARMAAHRSHRRFTPDPVDEATLQAVLSAAFSAPTKSDLQQASVVRMRDAQKRRALVGLIPSMPWLAEAPEFLVFLGDSRRVRRICALKGKPFEHPPLDAFLNAAVDAALVLGWCVRAAEEAGLGCCPISWVREPIDEVADLLELPEHVFPVAGLALGHPAGTPWASVRLPLRMTVMTDRYDDADLEAELAAYDARRREANPIKPEKQRRQDAYGTLGAEDYGWSEDKARQVSVAERTRFPAFVRRQGFDL